MKISALEEYGLRCLMQLARAGAEPGAGITMATREIAELEGLGLEYAAQILTALRKSELVTSVRGVNGGYLLARPAAAITVGAMFRAFESPFADTVCESYTGQLDTCANEGSCQVAPIWQELSRRIYAFLDSMTLADVAAGNIGMPPQIVPLEALRRRS